MLQTAPDSCTHTSRWDRWSPTSSLRAHVPGNAYRREAAPGAPRDEAMRLSDGSRAVGPPKTCAESPRGPAPPRPRDHRTFGFLRAPRLPAMGLHQ